MAKRGRKPAGVSGVVRDIEPLAIAPKAPKTLGKHGTSCWERLAPLLIERRLLTSLHLESLELLCDCWDQYQRQKIYLAAHPTAEFFTTASGYEQCSPRVVARDKAYANFVKLCTQFGLTPQASGRLSRAGEVKSKRAGGDSGDEIGQFAASKYGEG